MHTESPLNSDPRVAKAVHEYCIKESTPLPNEVNQHHVKTIEYCEKNGLNPVLMINPLEAQLLTFLARLLDVKRVLELGAFTGYSALSLSHAVPKAEIITLDLPTSPTSGILNETLAARENVTVIERPAAETLKTLTGQFDLIFLDADKTGYVGYVETVIEKRLLSPRGLIFADNTLSRGMAVQGNDEVQKWGREKFGERSIANGKVMHEFNEWVKNHPKLEVVLLPMFDGVTLIRVTE